MEIVNTVLRRISKRRAGSASDAQDPYDVKRFIYQQDLDFYRLKDDLRKGEKICGEWVWYHFPQHYNLSKSQIAKQYGIKNLDEAIAYLSNDRLRERLNDLLEIILSKDSRRVTAHDIFDDDSVKVKSSLTLFEYTAEKMREPYLSIKYSAVLDIFFESERDERAIQLLDFESHES